VDDDRRQQWRPLAAASASAEKNSPPVKHEPLAAGDSDTVSNPATAVSGECTCAAVVMGPGDRQNSGTSGDGTDDRSCAWVSECWQIGSEIRRGDTGRGGGSASVLAAASDDELRTARLLVRRREEDLAPPSFAPAAG